RQIQRGKLAVQPQNVQQPARVVDGWRRRLRRNVRRRPLNGAICTIYCDNAGICADSVVGGNVDGSVGAERERVDADRYLPVRSPALSVLRGELLASP